MKRYYLILAFCFFSRLFGQEGYYVTISNQLARPLAMGGAFTAVIDDLPALNFNPAAFLAPVNDSKISFRVLLNPVSPFIINETDYGKNNWQFFTNSIIQGLTLGYGKLSFGIVLYNESTLRRERLNRTSWFKGDGLLNEGSSTAGISLALAPRVSIGMSGELFRKTVNDKVKYGLGFQYGIFLKMKSHLEVGLSFISFPNDFTEQKETLERLSNETLNVGVVYSPWYFTKISVDVRNVSNEEQLTVREPHIGLEISPINTISLRGGFFQEKSGRTSASIGVGLNINSGTNSFSLNNLFNCIRVDATLIWERDGNVTNRWFFLTSSIGI